MKKCFKMEGMDLGERGEEEVQGESGGQAVKRPRRDYLDRKLAGREDHQKTTRRRTWTGRLTKGRGKLPPRKVLARRGNTKMGTKR